MLNQKAFRQNTRDEPAMKLCFETRQNCYLLEYVYNTDV
jgi:hypothetical protein